MRRVLSTVLRCESGIRSKIYRFSVADARRLVSNTGLSGFTIRGNLSFNLSCTLTSEARSEFSRIETPLTIFGVLGARQTISNAELKWMLDISVIRHGSL